MINDKSPDLMRVAAIPTEYRGRLYRSRLEAKWAAFFDILGWPFEYEPCDLGSWSPDFGLFTNIGGMEFVEVKPILGYHHDTAMKVARAVFTDDQMSDEFNKYVLVVGIAPYWLDQFDSTLPHRAAVGWIVSNDWFEKDKPSWQPAPFRWDVSTPTFADYSCNDAPFGMLKFNRECDEIEAPDRSDEVMRMWAAASNAVQWKGRRRVQ